MSSNDGKILCLKQIQHNTLAKISSYILSVYKVKNVRRHCFMQIHCLFDYPNSMDYRFDSGNLEIDNDSI